MPSRDSWPRLPPSVGLAARTP
uniref:Uncharacterized protein n=1 Tax=Triticum urartu TaxID=4572 RepID=A0A8R7PSI7_TRIUA